MRTHLEIAVAVGKLVDDMDESHGRHLAKNYPTLKQHKHELEFLRCYARISKEGSVECFVDLRTGDVYQPASWKAPNRDRRCGNVFETTASALGRYGYL